MELKPVRCLYYPYSRCLDENTLKKAILLFDEISFLDSQPTFIRRELLKTGFSKHSELVEKNFEFLINEGVIKIENPEELIKKYDLLLTTSIRNDINDDDFCNAAISESAEVWNVLSERLPPTFIGYFYPGAGTFSEAISLQALLNVDFDFDKLPDRIKQFASWRYKGVDKKQAWQIFKERYKFVIGGNPHIKLESYALPFLQASSLRINEALLVCALQGYQPFTDSRIHKELLNRKVNRTVNTLRENKELRNKVIPDLQYELPKEQLATSIVDELVPDRELSKRSLKDILKYKRKNEKLLQRFRIRISELTAQIEEIGYEEGYYRQIKKIIDKDVIPEIQKLQDEVKKTYEENFGRIAIHSAGVMIPTLSLSIMGGLGFTAILGACALAELVYLSTKGTNELVEIWATLKETKRNSFSYVVNLT